MRKAIAIDFDGCLCTEAYPEIGEPNWPVIQRAKQEQQAGAGLILWTVREGPLLQEAVDACKRWGLTFDAVNESLPDWIEAYGNRPRKVGASEYWDDRAIQIPAPCTKGKWIYISDWPQCSRCGASAEVDRYEHDLRGKIRPVTSDYCPWCGAKMDGEER